MDGERCDRSTLERRLRQRADQERRSITRTSPTRIRLIAPGGSADARARDLAQFLDGLGFSNLSFHDRAGR